MSHASLKRSRQEPGHRVDHHPRNHNILEDYEDSVVARMPKKGMNVNAETERDKKDHEEEQVNKFARLPCVLAYGEPGYIYASEIRLHNLDYDIAKKPFTQINDDTYLKIVSPLISAFVTVEIPPLPEGGHYQVGWIQVCTNLQFLYIYGNKGIGSCEIPELVTGKYLMINAGEGVFPWHGSMEQVANIKGPTLYPTFAPICMQDKLITSGVPWKQEQTSDDTNLTYVYRKQRFYAFLALKDVNTNIFQIIQTLTWTTEFAIAVDLNEPRDERAAFLGPEQDIPRFVPLYLTPPLESNALNPPNAKDAQIYIWRPKKGDLQLTLPTQTTFPDLNLSLIRDEAIDYEIIKLSIKKYARKHAN